MKVMRCGAERGGVVVKGGGFVRKEAHRGKEEIEHWRKGADEERHDSNL